MPLTAFPGFTSPNYTQVPDELFDLLMPELADCELRVLLYIVRRTFGFKRDTDTISLAQMVSGLATKEGRVLDRGTGLSKATVARGLKGLRDKGVIVAARNISREHGHEPTTYRLRFRTDPPVPGGGRAAPLSRRRDEGHAPPLVSGSRQGLSRRQDTQDTVRQDTDFEDSNGESLAEQAGIVAGARAPRLVPAAEAGAPADPERPRSQPSRAAAPGGLQPVAATLRRQAGHRATTDDRQAVTVAIRRFADELGDRADHRATVSRALNLFAASGLGSDRFVDLLYQARGEVRDRRAHPGRAPLPRNPMAYFFAVVEDRLGLRRDGQGPTG